MISADSSNPAPASPELARQSWLVRVRVLAALIGLAVLASSGLFGDWPADSARVAFVLAALLASNFPLARRLRAGRLVSDPVVAAILAVDVALFTYVLSLTGGSANPFSSGYLLYVAVAALLLSPGWTSGVVAVAVAAYGGLYWIDSASPHHGHHSMQLHLLGMWVAFVVVGPVVAYAITRLRNQADAAERALALARRRQQRAEKLGALATLSAGAAHELATPLGTIAVIAKDIEHRDLDPELTEDARLIRDEIGRCTEILSQLAVDVGAGIGEASQEVRLGQLADDLASVATGVRLEADASLRARAFVLPRRLSTQALAGLVKNARHASGAHAPVDVRLRMAGDDLIVEVEDRGHGMDDDVREHAGEPFFTTKPAGEGMGLGLFFAGSVVEHLGGQLDIDSAPGRGTRVTVRIPPQRPIRGAARGG